MSRCKICGEEYGSSLICSVCGTPKPKDADLEDRKPLSPQSAQEAKLKMIENCKKSVCKVNVTYDNGSGCHGTGWRGGKNVIITNAHVVDTGSDKVHTVCLWGCFLHSLPPFSTRCRYEMLCATPQPTSTNAPKCSK